MAATLELLDGSGKAIGKVDVPAAFAREPKTAVLHFAVTRHLANRRAGTADTKTRDEVSGGGKKPWRQKGTGRARAGSIRSPLWRKGGVVFGPHPRSYKIAMNRRARRAALAMAVAAKAADGGLRLLDAAAFKPAKTKEFAAFIEGIVRPAKSDDAGRLRKSARVFLVLHPEKDENATTIARAGRNLAALTIAPFSEVSAHALLAHDEVIFTKNAYDALAEVCGG
ncbi:MAG: 50S ribosomal protein L4 [Candidatus Eremiobacteraeota bacterium]|nr:50S ribosomal protein L4 [Candidatus Eremiobacteraeota bacterium]